MVLRVFAILGSPARLRYLASLGVNCQVLDLDLELICLISNVVVGLVEILFDLVHFVILGLQLLLKVVELVLELLQIEDLVVIVALVSSGEVLRELRFEVIIRGLEVIVLLPEVLQLVLLVLTILHEGVVGIGQVLDLLNIQFELVLNW